jgi:uncharacterized membrane protein
MNKSRLEAFSDGVLAIIITIMVLEIKVPHGSSLADLRLLLPVFGSYVLSFTYVAIYWNNHHHLMQAIKKVNGAVLWANIHLLFWLSLLPFAAGWMGENHFEKWPVIVYGIVLGMCGVAFFILIEALKAVQGQDAALLKSLGEEKKGTFSISLQIFAIGLAFFYPPISFVIYIITATWWLIPNKKIERLLEND